jgi:hypothetical protein
MNQSTRSACAVGPIRESQMSQESIRNWTLYFNLNDTLDFLAISSE